jgi:hypothetical protein
VNDAVAPEAMDASWQVTVPVAPPDGVLQVNVEPVFCTNEANVAFAGTVSVSVTDAAGAGPPFVTEIVYVRSVPAAAVAGPLFVTLRSAFELTVAEVVDELFNMFGSPLSLCTVAVLLSGEGVAGRTFAVNVNCALPPLSSVSQKHVTVPLAPAEGTEQFAAGPLF